MDKLIKIFRKIQRPIFISAFILTTLSFVYALIFSTNIYLLCYYVEPGFMFVEGADMYFAAQDFNRTLLNLSLVFIAVGISMFVFFNQKRRKYYLSNYITSCVYCGYGLFMSLYILINTAKYLDMFLQVDFETYKWLAEDNNYRYSDSTFIFTLGFILSVLLIISVALVAVNLVAKIVMMKKEKTAAVAAAVSSQSEVPQNG